MLPFDNLSGDSSQEYFSDGLTEELITELARVAPKRLGMIARTSAMRYKGSRKDVARIGRELEVAYVVVEGSVRRAGGSMTPRSIASRRLLSSAMPSSSGCGFLPTGPSPRRPSLPADSQPPGSPCPPRHICGFFVALRAVSSALFQICAKKQNLIWNL